MCAKSIQWCLTLWDLKDPSLPGSSVHDILQARVLQWVAMPSSMGSSRPRDPACISFDSYIGRWARYHSHHLGALHQELSQMLLLRSTYRLRGELKTRFPLWLSIFLLSTLPILSPFLVSRSIEKKAFCLALPWKWEPLCWYIWPSTSAVLWRKMQHHGCWWVLLLLIWSQQLIEGLNLSSCFIQLVLTPGSSTVSSSASALHILFIINSHMFLERNFEKSIHYMIKVMIKEYSHSGHSVLPDMPRFICLCCVSVCQLLNTSPVIFFKILCLRFQRFMTLSSPNGSPSNYFLRLSLTKVTIV